MKFTMAVLILVAIICHLIAMFGAFGAGLDRSRENKTTAGAWIFLVFTFVEFVLIVAICLVLGQGF